MIQFRGREQQRPEMGVRLLERLAEELAEVSTIESRPRQDGRNMVMVLAPLRGKAEVRRGQNSGNRKGRERLAVIIDAVDGIDDFCRDFFI